MTNLLEQAESSAVVKRYSAQGQGIVEHARQFRIVTDADMVPVSEFLGEIARSKKVIKDELDPIISDAHSMHKKLTTMRAGMLAPYEEAESISKRTVSLHMAEQERIKREEQARLDRERLEAERKERERLEKLAMKNIEKGNEEKAQEYIERSESVFIAPTVTPEIVRSVKTDNGGMTGVKDIEVVVVDVMALLRGILAGKIPQTAISAEMGRIKKWAKDYQIDQREALNLGIRITETFSVRRT